MGSKPYRVIRLLDGSMELVARDRRECRTLDRLTLGRKKIIRRRD
jgi:hypothetical protein